MPPSDASGEVTYQARSGACETHWMVVGRGRLAIYTTQTDAKPRKLAKLACCAVGRPKNLRTGMPSHKLRLDLADSTFSYQGVKLDTKEKHEQMTLAFKTEAEVPTHNSYP